MLFEENGYGGLMKSLRTCHSRVKTSQGCGEGERVTSGKSVHSDIFTLRLITYLLPSPIAVTMPAKITDGHVIKWPGGGGG